MMATLYLNDEACNRQTAPVITCDAAWVVQMQGSQPEVRSSLWLCMTELQHLQALASCSTSSVLPRVAGSTQIPAPKWHSQLL